MALAHFTIEEDKDDLIPMIKDALAASEDGFKIFGSPWTAAPWMKDNNKWVGGKLLPEYYDTWALFFSKYLDAYKAEGIDIWGVTVENEPLGNDQNWESMHFTAEDCTSALKLTTLLCSKPVMFFSISMYSESVSLTILPLT